MNCPSRTDDTLEHDEWNQNPPPLAPDLTTGQDLNGIVNAREDKDERAGSSGLYRDCKWEYSQLLKEFDKGGSLPFGNETSLTLSGIDNAFPTMSSSFNARNRTSRSTQSQPTA